jgi:thiol-disulfide isomerase/thioredoxin
MIFSGKKVNEDRAESVAMQRQRFMSHSKRTDPVWLWKLVTFTLLALVLQIGSQAAEPTSAAGSRAGMTIWPEPKPVPTVDFVDGEGKPRTLADFKGKVVLLNVWATWCGPCREEMSTLDRLQAQLGGADFQVLALSVDQDGAQIVRDFYAEIGIQHLELYIDENAQANRRLNAFGLPVTLLLDRQGRELGRKLGAAEWDSPEVIEYLREVIASAQRS